MQLSLGIDIACRAAHQASLADARGNFIWTGRRFRTSANDLERLWALLPEADEPEDITVVMEPTRNAWVPLAAWFRRRGARVVLVPPERSADLRAYYSKHTKTDRLDSRLLARLPLLHPEGLHAEQGLGPGDPLRRGTRLHQTLTRRRSQSLARLDALLEILGPAWLEVFGADLSNKTPLRFLAAGYACPDTVKRLGKARLARFFYRHSRGRWGEEQADALLAAAAKTRELWAEDLDFGELADDIAIEARLALRLGEELKDLDERIGIFFAEADPKGILTSVPGVGPHPRRADPRETGGPQPVPFTRRGPLLQRARPLPGFLRDDGQARGPDEARGRVLARGALHRGRSSTADRPEPRGSLSPADGAGRQASQLGAVSHRHDVVEPDRRVLEGRRALRHPRHRRHRGERRRRQAHHR